MQKRTIACKKASSDWKSSKYADWTNWSNHECIGHRTLQWNLVITRSLVPWELPSVVTSGFSLYQWAKTKKYKELGPAKLPCYKRVLLYLTSLYKRGSTVYDLNSVTAEIPVAGNPYPSRMHIFTRNVEVSLNSMWCHTCVFTDDCNHWFLCRGEKYVLWISSTHAHESWVIAWVCGLHSHDGPLSRLCNSSWFCVGLHRHPLSRWKSYSVRLA